MGFFLRVITAFLLFTMFASCSMERRHYRNGYYVHWENNHFNPEKICPDTMIRTRPQPDSSVRAEHSGQESITNDMTIVGDTSEEILVSGSLKEIPSDSTVRVDNKKGEIPPKENVFKYKHLSIIGLATGALGVGISVAAVYVFSFELFLLGFLMVGGSIIIALVVLACINRITRLYPQLRWPSGKRNLESPYANSSNPDDELLWKMRKARLWAMFISWFILFALTTGLMLALGI